MASYNYNTISESPSSFQDKFLEYSKNWEDSDYIEKKRVKIIKEEKGDLEKVVNSFIIGHQSKIKILNELQENSKNLYPKMAYLEVFQEH